MIGPLGRERLKKAEEDAYRRKLPLGKFFSTSEKRMSGNKGGESSREDLPKAVERTTSEGYLL